MSRQLTVAAAQMGPVQRADTRSEVIDRLIAMLHRAHEAGATLVVFPELALTTFFPRWVIDDAEELDDYFEAEMPGNETEPLFAAARELGIGFHLGYAEMATGDDGAKRYFNTAIIVDREGRIAGKYRKVHIPGHAEPEPGQAHQHLEKRYFEPGDLGFPVFRTMDGVMGMCICNDRRWPETYRVMGLQGVELVMLGYNTPSTNPFAKGQEAPHLGMFHNHLSMQAGAYQNGTWVVAAAEGRDGGGDPPHGRELHHRAHGRDRGPGADRGRRGDRRPDRHGARRLYPRDHLRLRRAPADRALRPHHQPHRGGAAACVRAAGRLRP